MLREVKREELPVEQRNEILAAILAPLTVRQNLRKEWHTRFVLPGDGVCVPDLAQLVPLICGAIGNEYIEDILS